MTVTLPTTRAATPVLSGGPAFAALPQTELIRFSDLPIADLIRLAVMPSADAIREKPLTGDELAAKLEVDYWIKSQGGPCKQGETSEQTGCVPAEGKAKPGVKPESKPVAKRKRRLKPPRMRGEVEQAGRGLDSPAARSGPAGIPAEEAAREYRELGTRSHAFKAWFGDWENDPAHASKVVDKETGEPKETYGAMKVYHGTQAEFAAFDPEKKGTAGGTHAGKGFYFAENKIIADGYAGKEGRVLETFLNIRNPLDLDAVLPAADAKKWSDKAQELFEFDFIAADFYSEIPIGAVRGHELFLVMRTVLGRSKVNRVVQSLGYDGILHTSSDDKGTIRTRDTEENFGRVWIAFEPNQIKAVENRGTFDPNSDELNKALSAYSETSGGALIAPPAVGKPNRRRRWISLFGNPGERLKASAVFAKSADAEFLAAFDRAAARNMMPNFISLVDLRRELGWDRGRFDAMLDKLRRAGVLTMSSSEGRHGRSQEERDASLPGDTPHSWLLYVSRRKGLLAEVKGVVLDSVQRPVSYGKFFIPLFRAKFLPNYPRKNRGQPCEQGETSEQTGCIPMGGEAKEGKQKRSRFHETIDNPKEWLSSYVYGIEGKTQERTARPGLHVLKEFAQYVPKRAVILYRYVSQERGSGATGQELRSWTYNREFAEALLEGHDDVGKVMKKTVYPDEILVDTTMLPRDYSEEIVESQQEVVVAYGNLLKEMRKVRGKVEAVPNRLRNKYKALSDLRKKYKSL